jgi:hypothetical protein
MATITTFPGGVLDGSEVRKLAAYTVVTSTDAGKAFISDVATITYTLPAIAIGNTFTFVYDGADGQGTIILSPNASDGIAFKGSQTDDKDLILTTATAKRGDYVTLAALDQTVSWQVTAVRGVWAKES